MTDSQDRWDRRYRDRGLQPRPHARVLDALADQLPATGAALDLAAGDGRNSLWLAQHGLTVTAADVSTIGLALAAQRLADAGFPLTRVQADLEAPDLSGLTEGALAGPWALILVSDFLHRPLLACLPALLAPDGLLPISHPTRRNLERHAHPSARFLLSEGELETLLPSLKTVHHSEAWRSPAAAPTPAAVPTPADPAARHLAWLLSHRS